MIRACEGMIRVGAVDGSIELEKQVRLERRHGSGDVSQGRARGAQGDIRKRACVHHRRRGKTQVWHKREKLFGVLAPTIPAALFFSSTGNRKGNEKN